MYLSQHDRAELVERLRTAVQTADGHAAVKIYTVGPPDRDTTVGDAPPDEPANVV
jgi:hypothetical protein